MKKICKPHEKCMKRILFYCDVLRKPRFLRMNECYIGFRIKETFLKGVYKYIYCHLMIPARFSSENYERACN